MKEAAIPDYKPWKIVGQIGKGSFGSVYEIQREDFGEIYKAALKVISIPRSEEELEVTCRERGLYDEKSITQYYESAVAEVAKEFAFMTKLKGNTNIVSYEDHQLKRHTDGIGWDVLVRMELLTPLSKYIYMEPVYCREIVRLGIDICNALERCQRHELIHRDIKMDNIFVSDQGDFKLGDFGVARISEHTMSVMSRTGTPNYMAPEVEKGQAYGNNVDIYSLGVVMYRLLNHDRFPFFPPYPQPVVYQDVEQANMKRLKGEPMSYPENAKGDLGRIVLRACAYYPADRYNDPLEMKKDLEDYLQMGSGLDTLLNGDLLNTHMADSVSGHVSERKSNTVNKKNETILMKSGEAEEGTVALFFSEKKTGGDDEAEGEVLCQDVKKELDQDEIYGQPETEKKEEALLVSEQKDIFSSSEEDNADGTLGRKKKTGVKIAGAVAAALLGISIAAYAGYVLYLNNTTTKLPDVIGQQEEKAVQILQADSLQITVQGEEYSDTIEKGNVVRLQADGKVLEPGERIKKNTNVFLTVSAGQEFVMENYVGVPEKEAIKKIQALALNVSVERVYSDQYDAGVVMKQDIAAGNPVSGDMLIHLTVSKGLQPFELRDFTGQTEKNATAYAKQKGLKIRVKRAYSSKVKKNLVIRQMPKAGVEVKKKDTVTLTVSKGPKLYKVPSLVGKTEKQADGLLKKQHLKLGSITREYSDTVSEGRIIRQLTSSGSRLVKNSKISIVLSLGRKPVVHEPSTTNQRSPRRSTPKKDNVTHFDEMEPVR